MDFELLSATIDRPERHHFGYVKAGALTVKGQVAHIQVYGPSSFCLRSAGDDTSDPEAAGETRWRVILDQQTRDNRDNFTATCLSLGHPAAIVTTPSSVEAIPWGLVLSEAGNSTFRRIGVIGLDDILHNQSDNDWINLRWETRVIVLV